MKQQTNSIIMHSQIKNNLKGFTLLELLVVCVILAIIAGTIISAISGKEERVGQGVASNTISILENATRQHIILSNEPPSLELHYKFIQEADRLYFSGQYTRALDKYNKVQQAINTIIDEYTNMKYKQYYIDARRIVQNRIYLTKTAINLKEINNYKKT